MSLAELRRQARQALDRSSWDFLAGGAGTEQALWANAESFRRMSVVPRVLVDVATPQLAGRILAGPAAMPVAVAPMAYQRLFHPMGERAVAAAAAAAGVPFVVSMLSSVSYPEIAATGATTWLQLYWLRDRGRLTDLIDRAEAAGSEALMLTVDVPVMARRRRDVRNGFGLPDEVYAVNLGTETATSAHRGGVGRSAVAEHSAELIDPSLSWADIEWLRDRSGLPLVLKGVLDPRDAVRAVELGVDALVVSNHGGRQLDRAVPPLTALPSIAAAVDGRCELLLDGGVRSGADILLALASGASAVLVGRPLLWGLAGAGEAGCFRVLAALREELVEAMRLAGCQDLAAVRSLTTVRL